MDEHHKEPETPDLPDADTDAGGGDDAKPAPRKLVMSRELRGWIAGLSALAVAMAAVAPLLTVDELTGNVAGSLPVVDHCSIGEAACSAIAGPGHVATQHDVPGTLYAGESRSIMFEFTTSAPLGSLFTPTITVLPLSAPFCAIASTSAEGGFQVRSGEYMVFSDIAATLQPLVPTTPLVAVTVHDTRGLPLEDVASLTSAEDRIGGAPVIDLGELLPVHVRIGIELDIHPEAVGQQCHLAIDVLETFPQVVPALTSTLRPVIDIVEYVPLAIAMGAVKTTGGPMEHDVAQVVIPALPDVTVFSLTGNLTVPLVGLIDHHDGSDWEDHGSFWFSVDGTQSGAKQKVPEPQPDLALLVKHSFTAGTNGVARDYKVCLNAAYVDGGAYKDVDGRARTCSNFHVIKVAQLPPGVEALMADGGVVGDVVTLPLFVAAPVPTVPATWIGA